MKHLLALTLCLALTSCAFKDWTAAHRPQINATGAILANRVKQATTEIVFKAAVDWADTGFKANYVDLLASRFYVSYKSIVNGDDVKAIVAAWRPNDGQVWVKLGDTLAARYEEYLAKYGQKEAALRIGQEMNAAAAEARG